MNTIEERKREKGAHLEVLLDKLCSTGHVDCARCMMCVQTFRSSMVRLCEVHSDRVILLTLGDQKDHRSETLEAAHLCSTYNLCMYGREGVWADLEREREIQSQTEERDGADGWMDGWKSRRAGRAALLLRPRGDDEVLGHRTGHLSLDLG